MLHLHFFVSLQMYSSVFDKSHGVFDCSLLYILLIIGLSFTVVVYKEPGLVCRESTLSLGASHPDVLVCDPQVHRQVTPPVLPAIVGTSITQVFSCMQTVMRWPNHASSLTEDV